MRSSVFVALLASAAAAASFAACSGDKNATSSSEAGSGGANSGSGASSGEGGLLFSNSSTGGGDQGSGGGCASESVEATLQMKPVDIVFVIDNSGSMGQEILGVQDNINQNFATIIENSGVDYRVIMLTEHGPIGPESVCIEAPLSGIPAGGCANPPNQPVDNPPRFFHHSTPISSHDALCKLLEFYDQPDEFNLHPMGWGSLLRDDSFKVFVAVTDDGVLCNFNGTGYDDDDTITAGQSVAAQWDTDLLALSPLQFGTAMDRNYRFYSLIALANLDNNNPALPWTPTDPMTTNECPTAADPGTGYQGLSILTEGLRFPLCEPMYYDVMFNEIAQGVIDGAVVACNFAIPDPPMGQEIDPNSVTVEYTPMGMGMPIEFTQVPSAAECAPNSFYIDQMANEIILCPDTCTLVQEDDAAKIDIVFQCAGSVN